MVSWISKELPKVARPKPIEDDDMKEMKAKKEVKKHADVKEDKKMVKKMVKKGCMK